MQRKVWTAVFILLALVLAVGVPNRATQPRASGKTPLPILEGPLGSITEQASGSTYWFQVGAIGDTSSSGYFGANVTIRTVYDLANNDAHSYWIGGYVSNLAFIQVGYLTTVSTDGSPYCCAWFWEYFPAGSPSNCGAVCLPHIGPEDSAGPIGSWHSYSMISNGDGTWSFYMDRGLLGTSGNLGATQSGTNPPAGLAEVADTTTNKDVLGPAEFVNMVIKTSVSWQAVPRGLGKIGYGAPSATALPNPYGSTAVTGVDDDFLAGSGLPQPSASGGTVFWHTTILLPYRVSFGFQDTNGAPFTPDWISFDDSGNPSAKVFYTKYSDQMIDLPSGNWTLDVASWHNTNVAPVPSAAFDPANAPGLNVTGRVFPLQVRVVGYIYSIPVSGASLLTNLRDSLPVNVTSDTNGLATFNQMPVGSYSIRILVPQGVQTGLSSQLTSPTSVLVRVLSLPELVTMIAVPVIVGSVLIAYAVRRERERRRLLESMPTLPPSNMPPEPPSPPPAVAPDTP